MDTGWLEDFITLAEEGNFSRAAETRNLSQPAFSRRIRALEEWVGTELVDRDTHRIALTEAGEAFRAVAEDVLRRLVRVLRIPAKPITHSERSRSRVPEQADHRA